MKPKSLLFFTFIVMMLMCSSISPIFNQSSRGDIIAENNTLLEDNNMLKEEPIEEKSLKTSITSNQERTDQVNAAINWIKNSEFSENGITYFSQIGLSGIGQLFLDLGRSSDAEDIGDLLVDTYRPLLDAGGFERGKWPNRDDWSENGVSYKNATGYEEGVAGIADFLLNLYERTNTQKFMDEVINIHDYLQSIKKNDTDDKACAWKVRDSRILDDKDAYPSDNKTLNGTATSHLNNLTKVDNKFYNITSQGTNRFVTNTSFYIKLEDFGIPPLDLQSSSIGLNQFTVSINLRANDTSVGADAKIYCQKNQTWVPIAPISSIGLTNAEYQRTFIINASDYVTIYDSDASFAIRVNSTKADSYILMIDELNITLDYNGEFNSTTHQEGNAGIGRFYINLFEQDPTNQTIFEIATGAANYTIRQAIKYGDMMAWEYNERYYTGVLQGASGIGQFLLDLHQSIQIKRPGSQVKYLTNASKAANWLINSTVRNFISGRYVSRCKLYNTSSTSDYYTGMDYNAGIGQFLLDLAKAYEITNASYLGNATEFANWLVTESFVVDISSKFDYDLIYKWKNLGSIDYSYSTGGAGALLFIDNVRKEQYHKDYYEYLSGGIQWLANFEINEDSWADDKTEYSFPNGLGGIAYTLDQLSLFRPEILNVSTPRKAQYDDEIIEVGFNITKASGTSISKCFITYSYGADYDNDIWYTEALNHTTGTNNYFWRFEDYYQNTSIYYVIYVEDNKGAFSLDQGVNNTGYVLNIVDEVAPMTELDLSFSSLGQNSNGTMVIKINKESARGAALDYVRVKIDGLGINDKLSNYIFTLQNNKFLYNYTIFTDDTVIFNETMTIEVFTYDVIGNIRKTTSSFNISDNFFPTFTPNKISTPSQWIPQLVEAEVSVEVIDIGKGIDEEEGVWILYTIDNGLNWEKVYMTETDTENLYSGRIPGQLGIVQVRYIIGAVDKQGNMVYIDRFRTTYEDYTDIKIDSAWSYSVLVNLYAVLLVVGIISGVAIGGYLLYAKRGDYLSRMRRKSKATATGLVIKERLTNGYYWLYDKFLILGKKIGGLRETFHKVGIWFNEHTSEQTRTIFKGVGRVLYGIPKGIVNGIANFFIGIGQLITKTKAWKLIVSMMIGLVILLTNVVQFIMEGGYPVRAVLFSNLGFLLFISGLVIFLMRFVYKLAYE